jgi:hypothetical protein
MRATPLTVLSPIPWWWALWIRLTWPVARIGNVVVGPLRRLSFIHFARWAVISRWPTDRQTRRDRAAPRSLLFLTSFDGSDIQYIEAFVRVVPWRINGLYFGAKGFPGPRRFGPVARFIDGQSHPVDHFWMAYPEASTTMVAQALALREAYAAARFDDDDPARFAAQWRAFLTEVQEWLSPSAPASGAQPPGGETPWA